MRAPSSISVQTPLAASGTTAAPSRVSPAISVKDLGRFRGTLLRWYDQHRRDLPWRETRDPYRIWLSEIMLQQTRVAAVLDHYRIFLERFPDVQTLAAAAEDDVLAAWSGLGYYRRARMLHRCAQQIAEQHGGCFPCNSEALLALPGIGRYTATAIASIAFAEPVAVVDGNVERVLQRFTGIDLTTPQTWQRAQALLARSRPGDFNQAMMELGATVCAPREPRCVMCPVRKWCVVQQSGQGANRAITMEHRASPPGKTRTTPTIRQVKKTIWCVLNQRDGGGIHLVQRPRTASLMAGMWELPQTSEPPQPVPAAAHWRTFRHSITVTNYTVHVLRNTPLRNMRLRNTPSPDTPPAAKGKWIATDRIPRIPITGLTRKILKAGGIIQ
jgi:A/G-specific adenine glycosylase